MKLLTFNQLKFGGTLALLTLIFRYSLSSILDNREFSWVWAVAVIYSVAIFIAGWIFGKSDYESLPLFDIGFRFHLTTYVIFNLLSELWFLLGYHSEYESIKAVHLTAIIWGIFLLIHFVFFLITRRDAIKGLEKSDIFE